MSLLFKKTKLLEQKIDHYLNIVSEAGLHFEEGIACYLKRDKEEFEERLKNVRQMEKDADNLRREIEAHLYVHTLIPESRGDVLALLETVDHVTNRIKATLLEFSVESPEIPEELNEEYSALVKYTIESVEAMVRATRAFFRNINSVPDHLHKIMFYEKKADKAAEKLKRTIFGSDMPLYSKIHLRYFTLHIDMIADLAEDVADRLAIYTIKRSV